MTMTIARHALKQQLSRQMVGDSQEPLAVEAAGVGNQNPGPDGLDLQPRHRTMGNTQQPDTDLQPHAWGANGRSRCATRHRAREKQAKAKGASGHNSGQARGKPGGLHAVGASTLNDTKKLAGRTGCWELGCTLLNEDTNSKQQGGGHCSRIMPWKCIPLSMIGGVVWLRKNDYLQ